MYLDGHLELCLSYFGLRCRDLGLRDLVLLLDPEQLRQGLDERRAARNQVQLALVNDDISRRNCYDSWNRAKTAAVDRNILQLADVQDVRFVLQRREIQRPG